MTPDMTAVRKHAMPFTRVEVAVMALVDGGLQVLLARRAEAPHAGAWALPGGVLRIDLDGNLDDAARRVMRERLGVDLPFLRQIQAVGGPTRDPRAPWALSLVYRALTQPIDIQVKPGKRVSELRWFPVDEAAANPKLAFDHAALIAKSVQVTRDEVEDLKLPFEFLPEAFTLGELQACCEQILGRRLHKASFRRRLADRGLVEAIPGEARGGANRPAQLFRWAHHSTKC